MGRRPFHSQRGYQKRERPNPIVDKAKIVGYAARVKGNGLVKRVVNMDNRRFCEFEFAQELEDEKILRDSPQVRDGPVSDFWMRQAYDLSRECVEIFYGLCFFHATCCRLQLCRGHFPKSLGQFPACSSCKCERL